MCVRTNVQMCVRTHVQMCVVYTCTNVCSVSSQAKTFSIYYRRNFPVGKKRKEYSLSLKFGKGVETLLPTIFNNKQLSIGIPSYFDSLYI